MNIPPAGAQFALNRPIPPRAYDPLDNAGVVPPAVGAQDGGGQNDDDDSDESDEDAPLYRSVPCPEMQRIIDELGNPGPRNKCFACKFVGEGRMNKIPDERLGDVFRTMCNGIGCADPIPLANEVAAAYAKAQTTINSTRQTGRRKVPDWTAASILDHWLKHTQDPQIRLWMYMWICTGVVENIREHSLWKENRKTKRRRVDKEQWGVMRDAIRLWLTVSVKDPRKFAYFNEDKMINSKAMADGGINTVGKPVFTFFSHKRGRGEDE